MEEEEDALLTYLKTRFLERIAHDLRGPSGVALGALDELERAVGPAVAAEHARLFEMSRRATRKILRVAQKLACVAELGDGPCLSRSVVRLCVLASSAARTAQGVEGRRAVALDVRIDAVSTKCERDLVSVDVEWIDLVLVELVVNALKHAKTRVIVSIEDRDDVVAVSILDDGRAPPARPKALFEPADETRGLGVSLAMGDRIARAHGGALELGPGRDGGTLVRLWLPRAHAEARVASG